MGLAILATFAVVASIAFILWPSRRKTPVTSDYAKLNPKERRIAFHEDPVAKPNEDEFNALSALTHEILVEAPKNRELPLGKARRIYQLAREPMPPGLAQRVSAQEDGSWWFSYEKLFLLLYGISQRYPGKLALPISE